MPKKIIRSYSINIVTILILIDGFLQWQEMNIMVTSEESHNPYFNRWFSAIYEQELFIEFSFTVTILILIDGFLQ